MTSPLTHNSSVIKSKDTESIEMKNKAFKSLILKTINDIKPEDSRRRK
jgi:hypothetical protein